MRVAQVRKLPSIVRVLALSLGAAIVAPFVAVVFGVDWRQVLTGPVFAATAIYSAFIALPYGVVLPWIVRRVGRRGAVLVPAYASALLILALLGILAGSAVLWAAGILPAAFFWRNYWVTARIACLLALALGMGTFAFEGLAARLREKELAEEQARKLAAEARLASLESHLHPHFLFNTLNSVSALIPVDPARAEKMVGQLAALLRGSLDSAARTLIPLAAEMRIVSAYLDIESARFGERLRCRLEIPEDAREALVPPFSVQCLVENAVKHGIAGRAEGGEIRVAAERNGDGIRIEVRDDGPGFDLARVEPGHGIDNLVSRLEVLFGSAAGLEVERREGWCAVTLRLP